MSLSAYTQPKQKQEISFFITPYIGFEYPMSRFDDKSKLPSYVNKIPYLDLVEKYGIGVQVYFQNKFALELGYGWDNIGNGFRGKSQSTPDVFVYKYGTANSISNRSLFLKFHKILKRVSIINRKRTQSLEDLNINSFAYWAIFDVEVNIGISYEYALPFNPSNLSLVVKDPNVDTVIYDKGPYELYNEGWGINGGIALQFYKSTKTGKQSALKRSFKLGFILHQGLNDRLIQDYSIYRNSEPVHYFKLISRGSYFGMYLAHPIRLFGIKKRKKPIT